MSDLQYAAYPNSEPTLRDVINLLRRRRWVVIGTLALFIGLTALITPWMAPVYRAKATMLVEQSPERSAGTGDEVPLRGLLMPAEPHGADTQVQVLQSGPLRKKVIQRLGRIPDGAYPSLQVQQVNQTDILEVAAESTDPRVAQNAANTLVDEYIKESEETSLRAIRRTRAFVERKLAEAQSQLLMADSRLRAFKEQNHIADLEKNLASATQNASGIEEELRRASNDFVSLQSQIQQVRSQIASEPARVQQSESHTPNPVVDSVQAEIDRLEMQRITLLRTLRATEPEVREVDVQIARLRRKLKKLPVVVRSGTVWQTNPQRVALQTQLTDLMTKSRGLDRW